jgi:alkylation response protein AidB-like acyl-CoA dehydrogenase
MNPTDPTPVSHDSDRRDTLAMLGDSAADFVRDRTDHTRLRERRGTLPGYDPALGRQMADLGWFGILVPEAFGGLGLGFAEMACVVQALGKGLLADPLVPSAVLGARVLQLGGNATLNARLLPALASASRLPALAWQEGLGGLDPCAIATGAQRSGGGWRLSGRKRFVAGAAGAAGYVVSARADDGVGLFWVDGDARGLGVRHEWRADETPSGVVELDGVEVPGDAVVCAPGAAARAALERAIDEAAVMAGAELLGVMEAALQMALAYLRTRVQFGKPIGSFQALQHKATDLYVQQELARAVLGEAVATLDGEPDARTRTLIASRCKSRCSDAGMRIGREVIQLHGAIGYTDEYDAGLYLKRAMVLSGWLGNASAHRQRFGALSRDAAEVSLGAPQPASESPS